MLKWFLIISTILIGTVMFMANVKFGANNIGIFLAIPIAIGTFAAVKLIISNYSSEDSLAKKSRTAIWIGVIFLALSTVPLILAFQTIFDGYSPLELSTKEGKIFIGILNSIYLHLGDSGVTMAYISIFAILCILSVLVIKKGRKHLTISSRWTK